MARYLVAFFYGIVGGVTIALGVWGLIVLVGETPNRVELGKQEIQKRMMFHGMEEVCQMHNHASEEGCEGGSNEVEN